jgi:hypothetical protein
MSIPLLKGIPMLVMKRGECPNRNDVESVRRSWPNHLLRLEMLVVDGVPRATVSSALTVSSRVPRDDLFSCCVDSDKSTSRRSS